MSAMSLPKPVEALWTELQSVRAEVLTEAEGLSQRQADWKPSEKEWSVGEVVRMVERDEIKDSMTIIAVLHAARRRNTR